MNKQFKPRRAFASRATSVWKEEPHDILWASFMLLLRHRFGSKNMGILALFLAHFSWLLVKEVVKRHLHCCFNVRDFFHFISQGECIHHTRININGVSFFTLNRIQGWPSTCRKRFFTRADFQGRFSHRCHIGSFPRSFSAEWPRFVMNVSYPGLVYYTPGSENRGQRGRLSRGQGWHRVRVLLENRHNAIIKYESRVRTSTHRIMMLLEC